MHFGYLGFYGRIPKNSGGSKWGNDNIKGAKFDQHACDYSDGASIKSLSLTILFSLFLHSHCSDQWQKMVMVDGANVQIFAI